MRHNLTIVFVATLLLFFKRTCFGHHNSDHTRIQNERRSERFGERVRNAELKMDSARTAEDHVPVMKNPGSNRAFPSTNPVADDDPLSVAESGNVYRTRSKGASATGISVGDGWAVGQGRAYAANAGNARGEAFGQGSGGMRLAGGRSGGGGDYNGESAFNPGGGNVMYEEEYGIKSGRDVAIARAGGSGRSAGGAAYDTAGYSGADEMAPRNRNGYRGVNSAGDRGSTRNGAGYPGINSAADERAISNGASYPGVDERATHSRAGYPGVNSAADERATRNGAGYPVVNSADDQGAIRNGAGYPSMNSAADKRVISNGAIYPGVDERATHSGAGYPDVNSPVDERGIYDSGYSNDKGPILRPQPDSKLDHGKDRRVPEEEYLAPDITGTGIQDIHKNVRKDGSTVYTYKTDGRPIQIFFRDKNGGIGVVNHYSETKSHNGGSNGNMKGTSYRSGFSLSYDGGAGNGGSVAYGSSSGNAGGEVVVGSGLGNAGGVAYGSGIRDTRVAARRDAGRGTNGNSLRIPETIAYGDGGAVAFASGSGFVSGTNIKVGNAHVRSRNSNYPNNDGRSVGILLGQGTFIGNGKGYARA